MAVRPLGKTGFKAGILGLGAGFLGLPGTDQATADRLVAEAIDYGVNYIDTAPNYKGSEERLGGALQGRRDRVFLVSKIETRTRAGALGQVRESLRRLQTDHLDGVLLHNLARKDRFPSLADAFSADGALGGLIEARKQGLIRHIGLSTHTAPARAIEAFETGEFDLVLCVLNFVDRHIYGLEEKLLPEARRRNIAVIAMKALGGPPEEAAGARLASPEDYTVALRYVWGLPEIATAVVGLRNSEELRQALAAARSFKPLDAAEMAAVTSRGRQLAAEWGPTRGRVS